MSLYINTLRICQGREGFLSVGGIFVEKDRKERILN